VSEFGALGPPCPNLFVVGAAKAGTTSLWRYLDAHPDVFMSRVKEPHFFSCGGVPGLPVVKDPAAYARLFAAGAAHRYRGEASPSYLWDPASARRIREAAPDARIIVSLRDPVERAYSNYWTYVTLGRERRSFADAVRDELEGDGVDMAATPPPYVFRGFYAEQLVRYQQTFGEATIVVFFHDLSADVRATMATIYERLDLDPAPASSADAEPHFRFTTPRNAAAAALLRMPGARRAGGAVLHGRVRAAVERATFRFEKPPLDPPTRRLLRQVYAPHDRRLQELLGAPLPWDGRP
jgi:hypothetical protein